MNNDLGSDDWDGTTWISDNADSTGSTTYVWRYQVPEEQETSDSDNLEEQNMSEQEEETTEETEETEKPEKPEAPEKPPEVEKPDMEKVALMARLAALEAREDERVDAQFTALLAEADAMVPDKKLDALLDPIESKEAKIAFLSKYIDHMKELGFPIEEKKTELAISKEKKGEREELVCESLFGMSIEDMTKEIGDVE